MYSGHHHELLSLSSPSPPTVTSHNTVSLNYHNLVTRHTFSAFLSRPLADLYYTVSCDHYWSPSGHNFLIDGQLVEQCVKCSLGDFKRSLQKVDLSIKVTVKTGSTENGVPSINFLHFYIRIMSLARMECCEMHNAEKSDEAISIPVVNIIHCSMYPCHQIDR